MVSDAASPDGKGKISFDMSLTGQGTHVINLDTGIARSNAATSNVDGKINMAAGTAAPAVQGETIRGTMRMAMTGD
jgi:hypothetical protein